MNCPACSKSLTSKTVDQLEVDACEGGCGGIWFDQLEIKKVDEPHEGAGAALLDIQVDDTISVDHGPKRKCPKCANSIMMRHFHSVKRQVEVDECPSCAGFWLDAGELGKIRKLFPSEDEKNKAAVACMVDIFGNELSRMKKESDEKAEKARQIAKMFRWICPSFWIPGDQEGGAF